MHLRSAVLVCLVGCSGSETSSSAIPSTKDASAEHVAADHDAADHVEVKASTCADLGCTTAFTCAACPSSLVCDDVHGPASCVTVETFFECGPGTMFCNSSCGICLPQGSFCGKDTCGDDAELCGAGARCGPGTHCVEDTCVAD